jgi:hypothetical protein
MPSPLLSASTSATITTECTFPSRSPPVVRPTKSPRLPADRLPSRMTSRVIFVGPTKGERRPRCRAFVDAGVSVPVAVDRPALISHSSRLTRLSTARQDGSEQKGCIRMSGCGRGRRARCRAPP